MKRRSAVMLEVETRVISLRMHKTVRMLFSPVKSRTRMEIKGLHSSTAKGKP